MIAALGDLDLLIVAAAAHAVDEAMLRGDAARPPAGEIAFQRLGFAAAAKRIAPNVRDEVVDLGESRPVFRLPRHIVLPGVGRPEELHRGGSSLSTSSPASASLI